MMRSIGPIKIDSYSEILQAKKKICEIFKPYNFSNSTFEVELGEGTSSLIEEKE